MWGIFYNENKNERKRSSQAKAKQDASNGHNSTERRNELKEERTMKHQALQMLDKKDKEVQKQRGLVEKLKRE